ncbi:hypothetical protein L1887_23931 [Cichorium endivia]|nr:hypothetical protein L1887_23931 [Cichorium endivia]
MPSPCVLTHEAIKKRDEISRQRDEVSRANEKLSAQLVEAVKEKDDLLKQKEDFAKQLEESVKAKDSSRSEIETAAQMLVTGIDKISGKVSNYKNFKAGGLPKSQKYSGLLVVAYGVIKRSNEIVEELHRQIESITKSRNEAQEQIEQRHGPRTMRTKENKGWIQKRDTKERLTIVIKILDDDKKNQLDLSDSLFLSQETDIEENIRACLAGLESVLHSFVLTFD